MTADASPAADGIAVRRVPGPVLRWARSPSTRFALLIGALMYVSYAAAHDAWQNPALIGVALVIGSCLPWYARGSNALDQKVRSATLSVLAGRLARFAAQLAFNAAAFGAIALGGGFVEESVALVGGAFGAALLTTLASLGAQEIAMRLALAGRGDPVRNVQIGLSANVVATAVATAGFAQVAAGYTALAAVLGAAGLGVALISDLRARFPGKGGVACLFGTFNPVHREHLALALRAVEERGATKVYVHPTGVPRAHREWLERGEIRIARIEHGFVVYERTEKADAAVDYFPTGNRFLQPETRIELIRLAIRDRGLEGTVEPLYLPDAYAARGFAGILDEVRRMHPGEPIHLLHGNDVGGFMVRGIGDGWGVLPRIRPMPVRRTPGVSATAIRGGAEGLSTPSVEAVLKALRAGETGLVLHGTAYALDDRAVLRPVPSPPDVRSAA
jgi:nicotinic acid mononucleotide adenylyltransferase